MAAYFSCELYYSIFRRHIERKIIEIDMNKNFTEKPILNFNSSQNVDYFKNDNFKSCNKSINDDLKLTEKEADDENKTELTSLYNASPRMDLEISSSESSNVDDFEFKLHQRQMFCKWFMSIIKDKADVIEIINGLLPASEISIVVQNKEQLLVMSNKDFDNVVNLAWNNCWAIIVIVSSANCNVCVFASKPLIIGMLESCAIELGMNNIDLYRVVAFLADCERPIIDLQLACSFVNSDKLSHSIIDIKLIIDFEESSGDCDSSDSRVLFGLCNRLMDRLIARDSVDIYLFIGCACNAVLASMEYLGIEIDMEKCRQFQFCIKNELKALERKAIEIAGSTLCLTSPSHLREVIYRQLKLQDKLGAEQRDELGISDLINAGSTNELMLSKLSAFHPLPVLVMQYRHMSKTKSIYVDSFSMLIDPVKKSISGTWEQHSSVTGRIYCSKPNLQAFPRDSSPCSSSSSASPAAHVDQLSLNVKSIFLSSSHHSYVSADFSQIELRLFAHLSNDSRLIQLFQSADRNQEDLFAIMAHNLGLQMSAGCNARQITKRVIYACLYGIGSKGLAEMLSISPDRAKPMINTVKDYLPGLDAFASHCLETVGSTNYLSTIVGRRRYFPLERIGSGAAGGAVDLSQLKRQMMSYVIQGSAADICKVAMINCQRGIGYRGIGARLILSRHDELVWRVSNEDLIDMIDLIYREMNVSSLQYPCGTRTASIDLRVPLKVKVSKGPSLLLMDPIEHLTES